MHPIVRAQLMIVAVLMIAISGTLLFKRLQGDAIRRQEAEYSSKHAQATGHPFGRDEFGSEDSSSSASFSPPAPIADDNSPASGLGPSNPSQPKVSFNSSYGRSAISQTEAQNTPSIYSPPSPPVVQPSPSASFQDSSDQGILDKDSDASSQSSYDPQVPNQKSFRPTQPSGKEAGEEQTAGDSTVGFHSVPQTDDYGSPSYQKAGAPPSAPPRQRTFAPVAEPSKSEMRRERLQEWKEEQDLKMERMGLMDKGRH